MLGTCLEGVTRQEVPPLEVVVVDNGRGDHATRSTAVAHGARYIIEPVEGTAIARNRGAHESTGEIVAYLDDDAVPEGDWLGALLREFLDPVVGAAAGRILISNPKEPVDDDGAGEVVFGGPRRILLDRGSPHWFERANFGGIGQGSNLAIRRAVFETWPGFDERLGRGTRAGAVGMEEHFAFFSLIDRGHRVVYTPLARVRHPFPETDTEARAWRLNQLTAVSFLCALLLVEEPRYRRRAARYALEGVGGKQRLWREGTRPPMPPITWWQSTLARFRGVVLYLASRREWRRTPAR